MDLFCSFSFFLPSFRSIRGQFFDLPINLSVFKDLIPNLHENTDPLRLRFDVDKCKPGEVFDGDFCNPCNLNSYVLSDDLEGSVFQCISCNSQDNFYCYGGNQRSPKRNFWRFSSYSEAFLRCPGANA